ncbi:putative NAD(P)-binding protein (plasmid) [Streptomyces davaonensis JCM 4913]|uniref:Putative NAD(P)-binding protein n=1 Tax=Streptomyces davaonensis (strain DSM 101723 / JCM 4913 / KCC S-0913 / 768) TaxID=1214101 RepID=K4RG98_STRDJ|nr:NAD(P)-dependent oxidoreductase [Streptomyces davaonensis]CCK32948.1 putative NAD(P)-binding protein [Streptomyces davaonensis JCM 4913]
MDQPTVGILHPGTMGAAVAACASANAAEVLWCEAGRSTASAERAAQFGLTRVATLAELLDRSDIVISLCPPAAAEDLAHDVARHRFTGVYVDANAINPARAQRIAALLAPDATVVDGGVVGSPPVGGKAPTLYLSGPGNATARIETLFTGTAVRTAVLGTGIGKASALKLAYASFQKTSRVLVALAVGMAREHGVDQELIEVASRRADSYLSEPQYIAKTAARAWRWGPELEEAADTLAAAGLPPEMLRAAASTLARWNDAKDDSELTLTDALDQLARP